MTPQAQKLVSELMICALAGLDQKRSRAGKLGEREGRLFELASEIIAESKFRINERSGDVAVWVPDVADGFGQLDGTVEAYDDAWRRMTAKFLRARMKARLG